MDFPWALLGLLERARNFFAGLGPLLPGLALRGGNALNLLLSTNLVTPNMLFYLIIVFHDANCKLMVLPRLMFLIVYD